MGTRSVRPLSLIPLGPMPNVQPPPLSCGSDDSRPREPSRQVFGTEIGAHPGQPAGQAEIPSAPFGSGAPGSPSARRRARSRLTAAGADAADAERGACRRQAPACRRRTQEYRRPKLRDGAQAAKRGAGACSYPPSGWIHWTRKLLADRLVGRESGESLAKETGRKPLKTESKPWLKPPWCMPPSRTAPCGTAREEVRDTDPRDCAEAEVLGCRDEPSRPQPKEPGLPRPGRPGQPAIVDDE